MNSLSKPFGYIEDFAFLNRQSGIMTGYIADTYPENEGFAYIGQSYERTPFGRLIESGLPSKAYAIDPEIPMSDRQTVRMSFDLIEIPGLDLPKDKYHFMTTTGIDGNRSVSILNSQKQQVAMAALGNNKAIISAIITEYTSTTKVETELLPAYFEGNKNMQRTRTYDYRNNLVSQTDPNLEGQISRCYDNFNQIRFLQTPDHAHSSKFVYQKYDKLRRIIEEGLCYDPWEKAVMNANNQEYPVSNYNKLRKYEYGQDIDEIGAFTRLISTQIFRESGTPGLVEEYTYDAFGRNISKLVNIDGRRYGQSWQQDIHDDIISQTNVDGTKLNYAFDYCGRPKYEDLDTQRLSTFSYYANNMIRSIKTPGGITEYGYTPTGWISSIKSPLLEESISYKGSKINEFTVKLNASVPGIPAAIRYALEYDEFGRLLAARCYDGDKLMEDISIETVSYDVNGNILDMKLGGKLCEYLYKESTDRLSGVNMEDDFKYNSDGAVVSYKSRGIESISYESGRPVIFETDKGKFKLSYDTSGNRLSKTTSEGKETVYLYNNGKKSAKVGPNGNSKTYLYGLYGLRGVIDKGSFNDVYTDHLGSPRIIGQNGKVAAAAHYTPYGKQIPVIGSMSTGFNGYGIDEETGLYYSTHRLYDPEIGRFLSIDPKAASESPYIFCRNDPINRADPHGDEWWSILLGIAVGIIGAVATVFTAGAALSAVGTAETSIFAAALASIEATSMASQVAIYGAAGAVGALSGDLVIAACDKTPITGRLVAGALAAGAVGGAIAAFIGPVTQVVKIVTESTALSFATAGTIGAVSGIAAVAAHSRVNETPVSGPGIAAGAIIGMVLGMFSARSYALMKRAVPAEIPQEIDMLSILETRQRWESVIRMRTEITYPNESIDTRYIMGSRFGPESLEVQRAMHNAIAATNRSMEAIQAAKDGVLRTAIVREGLRAAGFQRVTLNTDYYTYNPFDRGMRFIHRSELPNNVIYNSLDPEHHSHHVFFATPLSRFNYV